MGKPNGVYHFAQFTLKLEERQLLQQRKPVSLPPKVFDALAYLVANAGRLVTKAELLSNVWPDTFVEEVTIARTISDLRKVLSSGARSRKLIETVPKYGYRFVPPEETTLDSAAVSRTVGREADLGRLRGLMESVASGSGAVVTIAGEAGIGKTTVAEDFLAEVEGRTNTWLGRGRCSERLAETDAFAPLLECLEDLMRGEFGEQTAQVMKAVAPTWYPQVAPRTSESERFAREAKTASNERMRREFVSFFEALARIRPVVLFLDDLHWADVSTCDLLAYLASRMRDIRVLILGAYRPATVLSGQHPFLRLKLDLERRGWHQELALSFLSLSDIACYIAIDFPINRLPEEFAHVVHERTEGNPLFMTDMLRFLRDRRILVQQEGHWLLAQPVSEIRKAIPVGIHSMIRLKLNELEKEDLDLLLCGAVQGVQFDSAVLVQVLSLDPADVEERLQALEVQHDFVRFVDEREFANHTFSVRYQFVHVFYQNALSGMLAPSRRAAQSLAIARTLVSLAGEAARSRAAELALLFESGRDFASASHYFLQAARDATRVFAYPEAAILCQRGLGASASVPESHQRDSQELLLSLTLGISLMATRGYAAPEVERTHRRSRELCIKLNETRRLLSVLWGLHTCHTNRGELVRALEVAREMRQMADSIDDPFATIESLHALGTTLAFMGRLTEAREALDRIFANYPLSQHTFHGSLSVLDPCVTSLSMLARLLAVLGFVGQAVEKAVASVELADRLAHPPSLAYATFWVGWIHHTRGEFVEACRHLESSMALSRKQSLPLFVEWGRIVRGSALVRLGAAAEGISEIRKSIERQNTMGAMLERSYCLTLLAEGLRGEGNCEEALNLCDEALAFAQRTEGRCYEPETHRVRGEMLLLLGEDSRLAEAQAEFTYGLQLAHQAGSRLWELRAAISYFRLCRRLGDTAGAQTVLAEVLNGFTEGAESPTVAEARTLLGELH